MNRTAFDKITEVEKFMMECHRRDNTKGALNIPYDSMAYGEALVQWAAAGFPSNAYFSTDDPAVLELAVELRKEFGLEVVTRGEGLAREQSLKVKRSVVTGFDWAKDQPPLTTDKKVWN